MADPVQLRLIDDDVVDGAKSPAAPASSVPEPPVQPLPRTPVNGLARSLEKRRLQAYLVLVVGDATILLAGFYAVSVAYFGTFTNRALLDSGMLSAYVILPLYLTVALYNGTYSRRSLTRWQISAVRALAALALSGALLNLLAFFVKINAELSRLVFVVGLGVSATLMVAMRALAAAMISHRWGPTAINKLVILAGGPRFKLPYSYHLDATQHGLVPDVNDPQALDRLSKYLRNMDEVIVSCPQGDQAAWSEVLKGTGIHGEVTHQLSREIGAISVVHHDAVGISALKVSAHQLGMRARAAKRLFDLAVAGAVLLALSPLMLVTALLIKLEDGGPIFFVQRRMGRGNQFFEIVKFRSMRESDTEGSRSATKDDERITRIGRFIRRTSIDELPQLFNVIKGEMSMVGPRPHALGSTAGSKLFWQVDRKYWQRHGLRPGITGLAQVRGHRGATDTEDHLTARLLADMEYVEGWSLWRDITILVSTLRVLTHDRAF